jgi:FMN-dependent NADH-azoreductase
VSRLLFVQSSPRNGRSESRRVADAFLSAYAEARPDVELDLLDLWETPLPPFDGDRVAAKMTIFAGATPEATVWDGVVAEFDRFAAADEYLFTVPMWNHGIPWILKHYIDTISQPGLLFGFDAEGGYHGLLERKTAYVVYTSAVYPAFGNDFHSTYFEDWLRFAGVDDIRTVRFQPTLVTGDIGGARAAAVAAAVELARTGVVAAVAP